MVFESTMCYNYNIKKLIFGVIYMEFKSKYKCINLVIDGREYTVTLYLSAGDVFAFIDYINSNKHEYNIAVAMIIEKHIIPNKERIPSVDVIADDETVLKTYISEIINEEKGLKELYDKYENENDCCRRFVYAVNDKWKEQAQKSAIAMANALEGPLSIINKQSVVLLDGLTKTANIIAKSIEPYARISEKITKTVVAINQQIAALLSGVKIPHISEKKKQELCESYECWGNFGWAIIPHAELSLYNNAPKSQQEANKIAMTYCKNSDMLKLFKNIRTLKGVNIKDFDEAIFDYEHKQYKSCAMILFSLLDAKLIRMQRKSDINPKTKRRDSGIRAAENIKNRIENELDIEKKFFLLLSHKNLFSCLSAFFVGGDDFKVQPLLANRNFVDHGMLTKNIRKRDCIQLFLLYYNFLEFFEILNSK